MGQLAGARSPGRLAHWQGEEGLIMDREGECGMKDLEKLLEISSRGHSHLCPRQILGVRMGLAGMDFLGFDAPPSKKRLLVISETDGCFVDGLTAPTGCTVGLRTLRVVDYGKVAAVFVDVESGQAVRLAPAPDVRQRAYAYAPNETRRYFAQMQAYQVMPAGELFTLRTVILSKPVAEILSRPGVRVNCAECGEEIINEREVICDGAALCRSCAQGGYFHYTLPVDGMFARTAAVEAALLGE
jgi:formylmethanofuran dehydrogenase subunit E